MSNCQLVGSEFCVGATVVIYLQSDPVVGLNPGSAAGVGLRR